MMRTITYKLLLALVVMLTWGDNSIHAKEDQSIDLTELSIEDLIDIEVTIASKKKQKLTETASAVFVITEEDIRRSGATTIPEILRMAPGLQIARIDSNKWAVSSRGFNDRFSNKLLVMIDGRSIYSPYFSGVIWDEKDLLLEDVERIEIIRGPGATIWGANAVNGVINIITKTAKDTQGGLVNAGGGSDERGFGALRYGGKLGNDIYYRAYTKYFNRDSYVNNANHDAADGWEVLRGGFRVDWIKSITDSILVTGDVYNGNRGNKLNLNSLSPPFAENIDLDHDLTGGHLLAKWMHDSPDISDMSLQFYYDRTERGNESGWEIRDTFDIDFQNSFTLGKRQEIVWGFGYRYTLDNINNKFSQSVDSERRGGNLINTFIQDEISIIKGSLYLTLGSKFEHNDYTGLEVQPSGRLIWLPNDMHSVWSSVSRAVRTPSRVENDGRINSSVIPNPNISDGPPIVVALFGDNDFKSEDLIAYELGYRFHPDNKFSFDIAGFYNVYDDLRTLEPGNPFHEFSPSPRHFVIPIKADNKMDGETYGIELAVDYKLRDWLLLKGTYSFLKMELHPDSDSNDMLMEGEEDQVPQNQFTFWSFIDLPWNLELDTGFRYVDNLPTMNVDSYINLDVRVGWKPTENLEISVVGQNLLDSEHMEFMSSFFRVQPTQIQRGIYGSIKWQF